MLKTCPFRANPARCFLLCSCTPLSETLSAGIASWSNSFSDYDHPSLRTEEQTSTTSSGLSQPHGLACPFQHHLVCLLLLICSFVACSTGMDAFASVQGASKTVMYYSTALCHLPLNPLPHLLILLLMMSICSLLVKQLLAHVIQGVDLMFFLLFISLHAY